jgi:hypothetical protein
LKDAFENTDLICVKIKVAIKPRYGDYSASHIESRTGKIHDRFIDPLRKLRARRALIEVEMVHDFFLPWSSKPNVSITDGSKRIESLLRAQLRWTRKLEKDIMHNWDKDNNCHDNVCCDDDDNVKYSDEFDSDETNADEADDDEADDDEADGEETDDDEAGSDEAGSDEAGSDEAGSDEADGGETDGEEADGDEADCDEAGGEENESCSSDCDNEN